jgi:hypothetical protein
MKFVALITAALVTTAAIVPVSASAAPHGWHTKKVCKQVKQGHHTKRVCKTVRVRR